MQHNLLRFLVVIIAALSLWNVTAPSTSAQVQGRIADEPLGLWYMRGRSPLHIMQYMKGLATRLAIGENMLTQLEDERLEEMFPGVTEPLVGGSYYLVQGLLPSFELINFQQVQDQPEALRILNARAKQFGETGVLTTVSENRYKVLSTWSYRNPLPEGVDESVYQNNQQNNQTGPFRSHSEIIEEDGVRYVSQTTTYEVCFRLHDNMLYESNGAELFDMQLPTSESLIRAIDGKNDLGLQLFFDRIPLGIRHLGWNMLNSGVGVQLQQRDEEPEQLYRMRKSVGDLALPLIQAVLFDVDKTDGWIRFATDENPSVRGQLTFEARSGSSLTKQLQDMSSGRSRFAPVLNDQAAVTVHTCVQLPPAGKQMFEAFGQFLLLQSAENTDPALTDSLQTLATATALMGEQNCIELMLKLGWSQASDGVIYGGIQIGDQPRLLETLHQLITNLPDAPPDLEGAVTLTEASGQPCLKMAMTPMDTEQLHRDTSLALTHAYLMQDSGCLWFALGRENAVEMLRQCIDRTHEAGLASRTPLLTLHFDGERWLSYPQDDPTGVGGLLLWLDENAGWFPPGPVTSFMGGAEAPVPLIDRVRNLGGGEEFRFIVDADQSGLLISASMGEAIGNYYIARMITAQDAMMQRAQQSQATRDAQPEAAQEATTPDSSSPPSSEQP